MDEALARGEIGGGRVPAWVVSKRSVLVARLMALTSAAVVAGITAQTYAARFAAAMYSFLQGLTPGADGPPLRAFDLTPVTAMAGTGIFVASLLLVGWITQRSVTVWHKEMSRRREVV